MTQLNCSQHCIDTRIRTAKLYHSSSRNMLITDKLIGTIYRLALPTRLAKQTELYQENRTKSLQAGMAMSVRALSL